MISKKTLMRKVITDSGRVLIRLALVQVEQHKEDCGHYHDGDDDVFKNQSGGNDALAAIGTASR